MTHFASPRFIVTRPYVVLAALVVCWLGWSLPLGEAASEAAVTGSRILAPGSEAGVMRATPTVATARDGDRSIDRRTFPPLAAVVLLAGCLGAPAATVITMMVEGRRALGGERSSRLGSRAPPRSAPA